MFPKKVPLSNALGTLLGISRTAELHLYAISISLATRTLTILNIPSIHAYDMLLVPHAE